MRTAVMCHGGGGGGGGGADAEEEEEEGQSTWSQVKRRPSYSCLLVSSR